MTSMKFLLSLLLLATYSAAQTSQGCVWTAVSSNCDDAHCPPDTVEITKGVAGVCPNPSKTIDVCHKGMKKLCCPRDIQFQKCEWSGSGPFCGGICA